MPRQHHNLVGLLTAPVLRLPDQNKSCLVPAGASDVGIGDVLEQDFEDGAYLISYVLRTLNVPERNYRDRELLAIVHVFKELRCYLHGSDFVVRTVHHPLRYLETQPHLSNRQVRCFTSQQSMTTIT
jgi:RNase H-like domain found in reverse transcriptase